MNKASKKYLHWGDFAVFGLLILVCIYCIPKVGTALYWDDLCYMHTAYITTAQSWILNRFGHMYLLKSFMMLAQDPFLGTQIYWCVLFFGTSLIAYCITRLLSSNNGVFQPLVSVAFLWSFGKFSFEAGVPLADYTVMFFITLIVFVYLLILRFQEEKIKSFLLVFFGLLIFWCVKSKETGIITIVLFGGLGRNSLGKFHFRSFVKDILLVMAGGFIGLLILTIVDWAVIGDLWYSLRLSSMNKLQDFNTKSFFVRSYRNTIPFCYYALKTTLFPIFLLYLLQFKEKSKNYSSQVLLIWLLPLSLILFITSLMIFQITISSFRFFYPTIPIMCVCASQFFGISFINNQSKIKKHTFNISIFLLTVFSVVFFIYWSPGVLAKVGWLDPEAFYKAITTPLAITIILFLLPFSNKLYRKIILTICLIFLLYQPVSANISSIINMQAKQKSSKRYAPLQIYKDKIPINKDARICYSQDIYKRYRELGRNNGSTVYMFNLFFKTNIFQARQFSMGSNERVRSGKYDCCLTTTNEWSTICANFPDATNKLISTFSLTSSTNSHIIILTKISK